GGRGAGVAIKDLQGARGEKRACSRGGFAAEIGGGGMGGGGGPLELRRGYGRHYSMWTPQPQRLRQDPVDRRDPEPDRGSEAIVRNLLAEGRTGRPAGGARTAGGVQDGVTDRRLQRKRTDRVRLVPLRR